jgi:thiol:disulfide interchange protein
MPRKRKKVHKSSQVPQYVTIGGVILLIVLVLSFKFNNQPEASSNFSILPETQLEEALEAGKPTLAFFHSDDCQQCIIMIDTVEQVFPEFSTSVTLIDINVYDPNNEPLLRRVELQYIPTLVFFDENGKGEPYVGVMTVDELRQHLISITGAQ